MLTDSAGVMRGSFSYDAYGDGVGSTGSYTTPLGYAGQYRDAESGLIYLRARYYDPVSIQFLTVDPDIASTRSPYAYVAGNPLNSADPTGLRPAGQALGLILSPATSTPCRIVQARELPTQLSLGLLTQPGQIASRLGYTTQEVNDAIHALKKGISGNQDVGVDPDTGEVYVELPDGGYSEDSIGNIHDEIDDSSGSVNKAIAAGAGAASAGVIIWWLLKPIGLACGPAAPVCLAAAWVGLANPGDSEGIMTKRTRSSLRIAIAGATRGGLDDALDLVATKWVNAESASGRINTVITGAVQDLWIWDSTVPLHAPPQIHVIAVLELLEARERQIRDLGEKGSIEIVLGYTSDDGQGGFTFAPELLMRLAALSVGLVIDIYFDDSLATQ
jgi:RHS repeat-associated protein